MLAGCLNHLLCLFSEEYLASVPLFVGKRNLSHPPAIVRPDRSCQPPGRGYRVTEGNMCGSQIQLYLVIFADHHGEGSRLARRTKTSDKTADTVDVLSLKYSVWLSFLCFSAPLFSVLDSRTKGLIQDHADGMLPDC